MEANATRIKYLMDDVREYQVSDENRAKAALWKPVAKQEWEPAFIRTLPDRKPSGKIPFTVELGVKLWSEILGFDPVRYYRDPLTYATAQLEMKLFHAKNFHDDLYIDTSFRLLIAAALEGSLFGVPFTITNEGQPLLDYRNPPLKSLDDLDRLRVPGFRDAGIMPDVLFMYERITELLDEDFWVRFPDWIMGPFGIALELRGFSALLIDLLDDLEGVKRLFGFIVQARKSWQKELDAYLGVTRTRGVLGNDDISCPTLSPSLYRDVIFPFEAGLSDYYGGIFYWHSCGRTTELTDDIAKMPTLDLFHCGPWTDVSKACSAFKDRRTALEIMVETVDKVQLASPKSAEKYLREMVESVPANTNCYFKVDSIENIRSANKEVAAVKDWIKIARRVLG